MDFFGAPVTANTNEDGEYQVELDPGCYSMSVVADSFGLVFYPGTVIFDELDVIIVREGQNQTGLDLDLPPGHSVGGTFTFAGPAPAQFSVTFLGERGEQTSVFSSFNSSPWMIPYVPEGRYLAWGDDEDFPKGHAYEYYNDANSEGAATVIDVNANLSNINFSLPAIPVIPVHVARPGGGQGSGDLVALYFRNVAKPTFTATTNASGIANLSSVNLLPGDQFQVGTFGAASNRFFAYPGPAGTSRSFPDEYFVATAGLNAQIDIVAGAPVIISGNVTRAGSGTPVAGASTRAVYPLTALSLGVTSWQGSATNASGDYTITGIPSGRRLQVTVTPPTGSTTFPPTASTNYFFPKTTEFFDVTSATDRDVELDEGGRIGGTITRQAGGAPVPFAAVYIYQTDCISIASIFVAAANGTYLSGVLAPGNYKVRVVPQPTSPDVGETWHPNVLTCGAGAAVVVVAGSTTTANVAMGPPTTPTGFLVSGKVTDAADGTPLTGVIVQLVNATSHFAFAECGEYEVPFVPNGTYDVFVSALGYRGIAQQNGVVVSGANVMKDFSMVRLRGEITGHVLSEGVPVLGIQVCVLAGGGCDRTDASGFYRIQSLDTGAYQLIAYDIGGLEPKFWNDKSSKAAADAVAVTNGQTVSGRDFDLVAVAADGGEPDDVGTPGLLSRPEEDPGPPRLLPDAPQARSFANTEDFDWFRFTATAGQVYRVSVTGGGFTHFAPFFGVFDGTTKLLDSVATSQIKTASGWTAPSTGEKWIGMTSAFSGAYTITLTAGGTGPPTPTVTSITPASGPAAGGTNVTITGTNFQSNATVTIGGVAATSVVRVNDTTITCKTPARPGGSLNDVTVDNPAAAVAVGPHAPTVSGTLVKGWFADFLDVPPAFLYHNAIEKIVRAGITTGCGGGNYCPNLPITRDAMAVFILRGEHGGNYDPPAATGAVFQDVQTGTFLAKWMEQFGNEGISTGCGTSPGAPLPNYCPTGAVTRDGMAVFLERGKNGAAFNPPNATGTAFCDVLTTTFLAKWMEQLKADNITQGCGSGNCPRLGGIQPNYCPTGTVTRGEMAPFIVRTFGL
jgi:hypothetical protein